MKKLFGVTTSMTTPFDERDMVDVAAIEAMTDFSIAKGTDCLYPCGTTGEMHLMSCEERELVAETVVRRAAGRVTVFIHTGAMTTKDTIRLAKHAHAIGADGIGVVTPSYFNVHDRAMVRFFVDVARSVPADFPVYMYGIPQCAGNDLSVEVAAEVARQAPNIVGVKYSYPDMHKINEFARINGGDFSVVVGLDRLFLSALVIGCSGIVSGVACPLPEPFVNVYKYFREGDLAEAGRWHKIANETVLCMKAGADMSILKYGLELRGLRGGGVRKPLLYIEDAEKKRIEKELRGIADAANIAL